MRLVPRFDDLTALRRRTFNVQVSRVSYYRCITEHRRFYLEQRFSKLTRGSTSRSANLFICLVIVIREWLVHVSFFLQTPLTVSRGGATRAPHATSCFHEFSCSVTRHEAFCNLYVCNLISSINSL